MYYVSHLCFQMGYLHKEADGSLLYNVVNQLDPDAEGLLSFCSPFNIFYDPIFMQYLLLRFYGIRYLKSKEKFCLFICRRGDS